MIGSEETYILSRLASVEKMHLNEFEYLLYKI